MKTNTVTLYLHGFYRGTDGFRAMVDFERPNHDIPLPIVCVRVPVPESVVKAYGLLNDIVEVVPEMIETTEAIDESLWRTLDPQPSIEDLEKYQTEGIQVRIMPNGEARMKLVDIDRLGLSFVKQ